MRSRAAFEVFGNTVRAWLRQTEPSARKYPKRANPHVIDARMNELSDRFEAENHRPEREQYAACEATPAFSILPDEPYSLES